MLHSVAVVEAVECYVCSWNPSDYKNGNDNHDYSDVCSAGHFDPERVRTHECSRGCEIVSMKDPNGKSIFSAQSGTRLQSIIWFKEHEITLKKVLRHNSTYFGTDMPPVPAPYILFRKQYNFKISGF
jgi:hypothetical protein